jgi:[FeFe] hydrogenase (group B1/B3)
MINKFDTRTQYYKYQAVREVARLAWEDKLLEHIMDIPQELVPGKKPTTRCCVFMERAVVGERVKLAMGGDKENPNVIEVIEIACDECPVGGYKVTGMCRGCLAHRCADACKFGAITIDEHQKAVIDRTKCKSCGACAKVCPYSAIQNYVRPCQKACKVDAISMNEDLAAKIDNSKCISCGACMYQCPFGAISEKSYILDVINILKGSEGGKKYKTYAAIAPAIASQFNYAKLGQVVTGLKKLGFDEVVEVALGADITTWNESEELLEHDIMTSSCCPAFVDYVGKAFPDLKDYVSTTLSPMGSIGVLVKETDPDARIVFIGPCTAKKMEIKKDTISPYIDSAMTFEELQALFDSRDIDITGLDETPLEGASYFGRIFAHSGGLAAAVKQGLAERESDLEVKPVICDGIEECKIALLKLRKKLLDGNFIEGMACQGGCISGNGCLTHMAKSRMDVENYGKQSQNKTITDAIENAKQS